LPLQISDILTFIFLKIDTLLIGAFLGTAEIALYEIARKIPEALTSLYEAFRMVFLPIVSKLIAREERKKASQTINNSTRLLSFVTALGALIALLFGSQIISMIFSDKYLLSVPVFVLLMMVLKFSLIDYTFGYSLVALGNTKATALINVAHCSISLICSLILIPLYGIIGAASATLAGYILVNPLYVWFLRRGKLDIKVWQYLKTVLIFIIFGILIVSLNSFDFVFKLAIIPFYFITCFLFSIVTFYDLNALWEEARTTYLKFTQKFAFKFKSKKV
jgi:O-antigen/teichoic acid export membrane protein